VEDDLVPAVSDQSLRAFKARLATKLTKILDEIEPAPKTGHNKDQGYNYQSAKDIVSVTRRVMARNGVMLTWIPNPAISWREYQSRSNNLQREATIWYAATFTDAETGYEEVIPWPGVGVDGNDKSLAKAATAAMKSFLATQFQIGDEVLRTTAARRTAPALAALALTGSSASRTCGPRGSAASCRRPSRETKAAT